MKELLRQPEEELALLRALAEFRYELRCFTLFSERAAQAADLQPQQHQLLLQVLGREPEFPVTGSYVAERLGLCHSSTVELVDRCAKQDLLSREPDPVDRRRVVLRFTPRGRRILLALSDQHACELDDLAPKLIQALKRVRRTRRVARERGTGTGVGAKS